MKLIQFIDCRESNKEKLANACDQIITFLDENADFQANKLPTETQFCPICGKDVKVWKDYPRYICKDCAKTVTDINHKSVYFKDDGILLGYYSINNEIYKNKYCFANGIKCIAEELPSGGVIIQQVTL